MEIQVLAFCNCAFARQKRLAGAIVPLMFGLCVFSLPPSNAQPLKPTRQMELTRLVRQDCGSCHGMSLSGGLGKSLLPADLQELSVQDLSLIILDGVTGTPMPPWRGLLEPQEVQWIARQLKAGAIKRGNRQ